MTRQPKPIAQPWALRGARPSADMFFFRLLAELDDDRNDCQRTAAKVDHERSKLGPNLVAKLIEASNHRRNH